MTEVTDELLTRIAERASDPVRRYMTAAKEQAEAQLAVELTLDEIERREVEWESQFEPHPFADRGRAQRRQWYEIRGRRTAWFVDHGDNTHRICPERPRVTPLEPPPGESDWEKLERIVGRTIPNDLKRLYSISDGGFGPGFTGLNPTEVIGLNFEDFRRRGPDYCSTVEYPASFLPIAGEMLDYHYDLDTGRIISSNQNWDNCGLEPEDIYDIAFQSLAAMMEDWLQRS